MSYRPLNQGGSYYDQTRLGYSTVAKNYGVPNRSKSSLNKVLPSTMIIISEKSNSCYKIKGKSSKKQNKSSNTISITKENCESSFKIN